MPKAYEGAYRVFTTEFDREVQYADAPSTAAFTLHNPAFPDCDLDTYLETWVPEYEPAAQHFVTALANADFSDTVVTFLLDHSGSLRGEKCCLLAATVGVSSECLTRLRVRHEVLGFTTRSWHGGEARAKWISAGRPPTPGRLCELLHIVYRDLQGSEPIEYDGLRLMTNPRILKENVDGEALQWAAGRLSRQSAQRRILIVISDGAPVDDSTLLFNGPNILDDHLRLIAGDMIKAQQVELYGVGLHYRMFRYYPQYVVLENGLDIGGIFLPVLNAILASAAHAPNSSQAESRPA
jgi:cobaltochelatase CobT